MAFELDGGVINAELIRQLMRNIVEKFVIVWQKVHHEMGSERRICGTHRPDVQVVHGRHARQVLQVLPDGIRIHISGHCINGEVQ